MSAEHLSAPPHCETSAPRANTAFTCDGQVRKQVEPVSLYSACRQWVQNEPDIEAQPAHAPGVRIDAQALPTFIMRPLARAKSVSQSRQQTMRRLGNQHAGQRHRERRMVHRSWRPRCRSRCRRRRRRRGPRRRRCRCSTTAPCSRTRRRCPSRCAAAQMHCTTSWDACTVLWVGCSAAASWVHGQ